MRSTLLFGLVLTVTLAMAPALADDDLERRIDAAMEGEQEITGLLHELIPMCLETGDLECEAMARDNLASTYSRMGHLGEAIEQILLAVALKRSLEHPTLPSSIRDLAITYVRLEDYDRALDLFEQAERLSSQPAYDRPTGLDHDLAFVYGRLARHEDALERARLALEEARRAGRRSREAYSLQTIGTTLGELGRTEEAVQAQLEALAIRQELGNSAHLAVSHVSLAHMYLELGRPGEALEHAIQAIDLATDSSTKGSELDAREAAHRAAHRLGRDDLAYEHALASIALQDELFGEEQARELERAEARAAGAEEIARLEHRREVQRLSEQARRQRLGILLLGAALIGLSAAVNLRLLGRKNRVIDTQRAEAVGLAEQARAAADAKGRFLAHMSRGLRTPMNAVLGFADGLRRDAGLSDDPEQGEQGAA